MTKLDTLKRRLKKAKRNKWQSMKQRSEVRIIKVRGYAKHDGKEKNLSDELHPRMMPKHFEHAIIFLRKTEVFFKERFQFWFHKDILAR